MFASSLLIAAAVQTAVPAFTIPWFEEYDYPVHAFERKWQGSTGFQLVVDTSGNPVACTVEYSSGHKILDEKACAISLKRAKFTPARAGDGSPAFGVYRSRINWAVEPTEFAQSEFGPDFEVTVNQLPGGDTEPVSVKYALLTDVSGTPVDCTAFPGSNVRLSELGCAKLKAEFRKPVVAKGTRVAAVQTAWITFTN